MLNIEYKKSDIIYTDDEVNISIVVKTGEGKTLLRHALYFVQNNPEAIEKAKIDLRAHVMWFVDEKKEKVIAWRYYGYSVYLRAKIKFLKYFGRG